MQKDKLYDDYKDGDDLPEYTGYQYVDPEYLIERWSIDDSRFPGRFAAQFYAAYMKTTLTFNELSSTKIKVQHILWDEYRFNIVRDYLTTQNPESFLKILFPRKVVAMLTDLGLSKDSISAFKRRISMLAAEPISVENSWVIEKAYVDNVGLAIKSLLSLREHRNLQKQTLDLIRERYMTIETAFKTTIRMNEWLAKVKANITEKTCAFPMKWKFMVELAVDNRTNKSKGTYSLSELAKCIPMDELANVYSFRKVCEFLLKKQKKGKITFYDVPKRSDIRPISEWVKQVDIATLDISTRRSGNPMRCFMVPGESDLETTMKEFERLYKHLMQNYKRLRPPGAITKSGFVIRLDKTGLIGPYFTEGSFWRTCLYSLMGYKGSQPALPISPKNELPRFVEARNTLKKISGSIKKLYKKIRPLSSIIGGHTKEIKKVKRHLANKHSRSLERELELRKEDFDAKSTELKELNEKYEKLSARRKEIQKSLEVPEIAESDTAVTKETKDTESTSDLGIKSEKIILPDFLTTPLSLEESQEKDVKEPVENQQVEKEDTELVVEKMGRKKLVTCPESSSDEEDLSMGEGEEFSSFLESEEKTPSSYCESEEEFDVFEITDEEKPEKTDMEKMSEILERGETRAAYLKELSAVTKNQMKNIETFLREQLKDNKKIEQLLKTKNFKRKSVSANSDAKKKRTK